LQPRAAFTLEQWALAEDNARAIIEKSPLGEGADVIVEATGAKYLY